MKTSIHRAEERGQADIGWLQSRFSFSFADYLNPERMGFGKLRVLNDDVIAPGKGFGTHPHDNMEIITIPLKGALAHQDSTGGKVVIKPGDIQVMSAGSGLTHSEFNDSDTEEARIFQIWIEPKERGIPPRHEERSFDVPKNALTEVVSGKKSEKSLYIHQDARILLGEFEKGKKAVFSPGDRKGVFVMVIEGSVQVTGELLRKRDSIEVTGTDAIPLTAEEAAEILVVEVPL